jgi:prevent-host-death family protein
MTIVSIKDLCNDTEDIVTRAADGEPITITRFGKPVAELRAVSRRPVPGEVLRARHRVLPAVDAAAMRADIDRVFDPYR